ncbi:hypothetical protein [Bradyrhizobium sp. LHD-71]|uniref:hypothetical protein n=1 Tax=Bradyrhizobium sp. LHD-71 TaxID=3072141 RepID=UPI00280EB6A3|nr:hypothetical protein [Bradyrhizobium sp. LHD-71]MDQ8728343.1 hypothetical protein [Bradyrhizobium sp. LHD-71]
MDSEDLQERIFLSAILFPDWLAQQLKARALWTAMIAFSSLTMLDFSWRQSLVISVMVFIIRAVPLSLRAIEHAVLVVFALAVAYQSGITFGWLAQMLRLTVSCSGISP